MPCKPFITVRERLEAKAFSTAERALIRKWMGAEVNGSATHNGHQQGAGGVPGGSKHRPA